jgi:hypothetical protein
VRFLEDNHPREWLSIGKTLGGAPDTAVQRPLRARATLPPSSVENRLHRARKKRNILPALLVISNKHMRNPFHKTPGRVRTAEQRSGCWRPVVLVFLCALLPVQAQALDGAFYRSLAIPGTGQAHQGHMTKAALFAGGAILSGVGLAVSAVQYNQSVDRFRNEKRALAALLDGLDSGQVASIQEINSRDAAMREALNDADTRLIWRNAFFISFVTVYALNIVDVIRNQPHDPDVALRYSLDANRERVLLTRSFRF